MAYVLSSAKQNHSFCCLIFSVHYIIYSHDFPGSHIVCQNCGWEDDNIQYNDLDYEGGANELSLNQSIQVYLAKTSSKTK